MSVPHGGEKVFVDNRIDMLFEGLAAVFRGPPLKRVDDAQVGGNRELAPRRVPQLRGAPLGVDAVQPGDGVYEQFVARAFGEGEVEVTASILPSFSPTSRRRC